LSHILQITRWSEDLYLEGNDCNSEAVQYLEHEALSINNQGDLWFFLVVVQVHFITKHPITVDNAPCISLPPDLTETKVCNNLVSGVDSLDIENDLACEINDSIN
jgi:hypothetical protein